MTHPPIPDETVERAARETSDVQAEGVLRQKLAYLCMAAVAGLPGDLKTLTDDLVKWLAAQRLEARGEISEAMVKKMVPFFRRAAHDAIFNGGGKIINPEIFPELARAALKAALNGEKDA